MNAIGYKPSAETVAQRLETFYARQAQDRILAAFDTPSATLARFAEQHPEGRCDYPDPQERIAFWDALLGERAAVEDDSIPSAYLSELDQGLYGGLVGGEVEFVCDPGTGWISSMVAPLLSDWSEFESLAFDQSHPWFERCLRQLRIFVNGAQDNFGISHFILIDGLNFVFELVGATNTYLSLLDRPDMVARAIDFAFDLNLTVQETYFRNASSYRGGTFSNMAQWIPGRIVSESVDPFHMMSPDYFETWGRANVERMFAQFDGGVLHIHGNGRHLLEAVRSVRGLKAIWLGDDKGYPRAFDVLPELREATGDLPLVLVADYASFVDKLDRQELVGGVFYRVAGAPEADSANRCMDRVRAYRT